MSVGKFLNIAYNVTSHFVESIPKKERKKYGQFFTSKKTAEFMASLFTIDYSKPELRLLDAGAGTGLLTTALVERLRDSGYNGRIMAVCYENDLKVLPTLTVNLENLKNFLNVKYEIRIENYLTSQNFLSADLFKKDTEEYDMIIGNPPYLKIAKDAPEALAMPEVCYGAPNLYFLFWAMGIKNLKKGEEMVYIIPRSWTSGAYFERFRKFLFQHCVIINIHIFGSRDKVFDGESVLQETMIIKIRKTNEKPRFVKMSSSETSDFEGTRSYDVDYNTIVAPNQFVFLVTSPEETEILSRVNSQSNTLESDDLRMRTGLIVDFRSQEVLRDNDEDGSFPLFYSHHIKNGRVQWPVGREAEYIVTDKPSFLQENTDYLFVKRFTSKEEKRRLQCGIYLKADYSEYKYISTQNKINFIKCDTPELAYGLYVLLNSTLYDAYYRILNGSTQVNSTEINLMPVPSKDAICEMGRELIGRELTEHNCDIIVDKWIR
ncbi:MAG: Eco57I restriction-modification methylase domain-containing protein [Bacteroidaceae bacterium]|nr:Eco57I restriction-modification methylase domain-containing protein [Bacteroidaceae bacterium]